MEPYQIKSAIKSEYENLTFRANCGEINESCIFSIIKGRCKEGARHNGVPDYWEYYLPDELKTLPKA